MNELTLDELTIKKAELERDLSNLVSKFVQEANLTGKQLDIHLHIFDVHAPNPNSVVPKFTVIRQSVKVEIDIKL